MSQAAAPLQNVNLDANKPAAILNTTGLNAAFVGSANDAVLRFAGAGVVTGFAGVFIETTTAADGTSVTITQPGLYVIKMGGVTASSTTVHVGISNNVAAAGLTTDPSFATAGFLEVLQPVVTNADNNLQIAFMGTMLKVIKGQTAVVRFHATNGADAAPVFTGVITTFFYQIQRLQGDRGHS